MTRLPRMESPTNGPQAGRTIRPARLRAIVSVPETSRVQCQESGCGHPIYAAVHIVEEAGQLLILGSTCFAKRYGSVDGLGAAGYGSGSGRRLTDAERQLLLENTQALLEQFRQEELAKVRNAPSFSQRPAAVSPHQALPAPTGAQPPPSPSPLAATQVSPKAMGLPPPGPSPWPWQKPLTSILLMQAPSGHRWIRVQHRDGSQKLVPWPQFPGWDTALPPEIGVANQALGVLDIADIVTVLAQLRASGFKDRVGTPKDVLGGRLYEI